MRIVFALVFLIGIGIAGFATYMAMQHFSAVQAQNRALQLRANQVVDTTDVLLAKTKLRYGMELKKEHVYTVRFPVDAVPENAFTTMDELFGAENEEPRQVLRTIDPGEIVSDTKVTRFGQPAGVSSMLKQGMRAFTVRVDVTTGVSGFLRPGDRVDIYYSGDIGGKATTRLLLQDVDIIAIDQSADEDLNRPVVARTVTVEVAPKIVATLAQAQTQGKLSLALRGAEETAIMSTVLEVDQDSILGIEEVQVVEEKKCYQTIRRGVQDVRSEVPCVD